MQRKLRFNKFLLLLYFSSLPLFCWLLCLNDLLLSQQTNNLADKDYKNKILNTIDSLVEAKYVLPDKAKEYATKFRQKIEQGIYNTFTEPKEFARKVTDDLIVIVKDKHFNFRVIESSEIGEKPESALHHPVRYYHLGIKENLGFIKLEWIEGNIGYLKIIRFNNFNDVKDRIVAAIKFMENADAIIIDIRDNGGGSGDILSSYFLKYPTQLTGWYSREDDFLTEFWTIKDIDIEPMTDVPLFLLTSDKTFSASESFAYDMKVNKRSVLVGDTTKGGANSVDLFQIDNQFEIYIPTARAINPVTGSNWEGIGVIPDISVPSETALDTAIVLARIAGEKYANLKEVKLKTAVDEMQSHLDNAERLYNNAKIKEAEVELDSVFQIGSSNKLINEFFINVLAYHYLSQNIELILYAILKKNIELFPKSFSAYETLAYTYYKFGKTELAIDNFRKVLDLAPYNPNALKMIERLKGK